ncbi:hypothetical protein BDN67DRAFT_690311 [Paxillus ammoniavirescens]|nr:hypothetical protein BDN67DRAFT_690311 [Paxillus ammoniavirescens]
MVRKEGGQAGVITPDYRGFISPVWPHSLGVKLGLPSTSSYPTGSLFSSSPCCCDAIQRVERRANTIMTSSRARSVVSRPATRWQRVSFRLVPPIVSVRLCFLAELCRGRARNLKRYQPPRRVLPRLYVLGSSRPASVLLACHCTPGLWMYTTD